MCLPPRHLARMLILCFGLASIGAAARAEDVPPGYEDAAPAEKAAPAAKPARVAKPAPAKEDVPQGYEDAAPAENAAPAPVPARPAKVQAARAAAKAVLKKRAADKAKAAEVPQGYEDAPPTDDPENGPAQVAPDDEEEPIKKKPVGKADPMVAQLEQQFRPQFQQLLKVELAFLRRACDPDAKQRAAMAKAGEDCITKVLRQCAVVQAQQMQGGMVPAKPAPNGVALLRQKLLKTAATTLRPEQAEKYRRESELRDASRKRAVINYMVARADQSLAFSTRQREKLVAALTKNYSDVWERSLSIWMCNSQFVPSIPDRCIVPLLVDEQKTVWSGLQKLGEFQMQMHWMMFPNMAVIQEE